jgi:FMN-dependent NADH-azoreductase
MKLLHIDSGILGGQSVSRELSASVVAVWRRRNPGLEVTYRDLAANPIGHLSGSHLAPQAPASAELARDIAEGAKALEEFLAADVVVIGAPMYNFSVPSQLKAWIDRIAVKGKTFRYTEKGPEGLAGGKKVIIASSRGGIYSSDNGLAAIDHQEPYLRAVFGFFGVTDIEFVRAEGVNLGPDHKQQAIARAKRVISQELAAAA